MNYDEHVLAGILTYPIAVLMISLFESYANIPVVTSLAAMSLGYAFYVLGSDLPDMDHPNALIHRSTKPLVSVAVGVSAFANLYPHINTTYHGWANVAIAWGIAALMAFVAWHLFTRAMPRHRGFVHSLAFAAVYGLLAFVAVEYGFGMAFGEALFVGLASFSGYGLHLILDKDMKLK